MSLDVWSPDFAIALSAAFVAGLVRGFSGFGAAMILIPVLATTYGPTVAVPVLQLTDNILTAPIAWRVRRQCSWREVLPLAAGSALTLPFGIWVLVVADPAVLTRVMGLFVLAVVTAMAFGYRRRRPLGTAGTFFVGNTAGLLSGSIGIGGPPVILFWLSGQDKAPRVRANIFVFFAIGGLMSLVGLAYAGLYTLTTLALTLALMPVYGLGLLLGGRGFKRSDDEVYRRVALVVIATAGLIALV